MCRPTDGIGQHATVPQAVREIEAYIAGVRSELDALWHAARDATEPHDNSAFANEDNRQAADNAAFRALQCLHAIEGHLATLRGQPVTL